MPLRPAASPLPPRVHRPARKSVPAGGSGSGFQRSRFGSGASCVNGAVRSAPFSARTNAGCAADGRMRYSHERRLDALGSVKALPLSCSAYSPRGARWGALRPCGKAPGTASELCSLPNPERWASDSAVFLASPLMIAPSRLIPMHHRRIRLPSAQEAGRGHRTGSATAGADPAPAPDRRRAGVDGRAAVRA